ncbi:acyl-CoA carboxylase subunit epsilon [Microbacterium sp. zg.Y1090]|uniref:acyl-CoA carboxylase epsilon subunit n=1 Tax=Microbacterium TaxID=33882 RepID=UPI00214AB7D9|nr:MULTISPECIES: acyl-CoA carboxylase epsilon subunit [unclassified Microbacterium]MCR2813622.1 acyl-CoA carboxylase subunit epsilon [Microbacterium sp. zg.Y1084]MCR2818045.1 acyl-CoA carboxylase subunit epsilon [Microbacterium sp. zg.Y1090]MDL5486563.1 acyl-CoA carboxylase epsilon subunit [Microbacterium sp. zg-Y1211]WIM27796.1 acyl-CoA carboxylase epsilon subunit [Microbacterium sp. zg-Y1090]
MTAQTPGDARIRVDVRRGSPTEEDLAAVVAVVTEAYHREAAAAVVDDPPVRPGWELAARGLRRPLHRAAGWRGGVG